MRVGGGALKRHQKQNRKKLPKSTRNSPQKVTQNEMALSSVQVLQQANYTINVTLIKKITKKNTKLTSKSDTK